MKNTINIRSGKFAVKWIASILLVGMIGSISVFPVTANPGTQQNNGSDPIYLPLVLNNYNNTQQSIPVLASPQNNTVLTTLIPHFIFDIPSTTALSYGCLVVDTGSNSTKCATIFSLVVGNNSHYDLFLPYNLATSQGYYWRVGVSASPSDFSAAKWSDQRYIIAGSGGTLLPILTLTSPGNNSTVTISSPGTVVFTWNAISGSGPVAYSIQIRDINSSIWDSSTTTTNQYACINCFKPGFTYQWTVQARDNYAWGPKATVSTFSTKP
jgi:hypothetical protein